MQHARNAAQRRFVGDQSCTVVPCFACEQRSGDMLSARLEAALFALVLVTLAVGVFGGVAVAVVYGALG